MSKETKSTVSLPPSRSQMRSHLPDHEDDSVATPSGHLIVGIGASAGGLDAFRTFLKAMPGDSGMGFVLIQHLDPDYESALADILQGSTTMPVATACDGCTVAPNTVWVIPQNTLLKMERGTLRVAVPETTTARRSSIDTFLISLAKDQGENAVAIILSGFGSDGTTGIGAIKEAGGFTLSEAEFDHHAKLGMPQSAAHGGYVDTVTEVGKMPAALIEYDLARNILTSAGTAEDATPDLVKSLNTICAILHSRLNRDFGQYKTSTLLRRVRRRMQVLRVTDSDHYIEQLRLLPEEPELLFREILISVTRFFRDATMFCRASSNARSIAPTGRRPFC
jgi:two-component system CheB/CheR fusion protein